MSVGKVGNTVFRAALLPIIAFGVSGASVGSDIKVTPASISANVPLGASAQHTLRIQNTGNAALTWSAWKTPQVGVQPDFGAVKRKVYMPKGINSSCGSVWDGSGIWSVTVSYTGTTFTYRLIKWDPASGQVLK